jgi:hypothetical protein
MHVIRMLAGAAVAAVLAVTGASVPAQAQAVEIQKVVINGVVWEHVSAKQNALDQKREKALGKKAVTLNGCPDDYICLYQWLNYGADRWQSSFYNLSIHADDCVSLDSPVAYWDNNTVVNNNSGSMVVNTSGTYSGNVYITILDWVDCNYGGAKSSFPAHLDSLEPDLRNEQWAGGITAYHRITSVRIAT